jgi:hypothetical protein
MTLTSEDIDWINKNVKEDTEHAGQNPSDIPEDDVDLLENFNEEGGEKIMPQVINDYSTYEIPKGDSNYLKMEDGDNRLRLTSKPMELKLHEDKTAGKFSTVICQGEGCVLCAKGSKVKYKYAYAILSRKDGKAYVYEAPITVFRQIVTFATNPEYGNPEEYDLTIKMSGQKPNIVYQVVPSPKKVKLSKEETEEVAKINLTEIYANKAGA